MPPRPRTPLRSQTPPTGGGGGGGGGGRGSATGGSFGTCCTSPNVAAANAAAAAQRRDGGRGGKATQPSQPPASQAPLQSLALSELERRARSAAWLSEAEVDSAVDAENPRSQLIRLLWRPSSSTATTAAAEARLRAELLTLKLSALSKRALASGVGQEQVDAAKDGESPKDALIAVSTRPARSPARELAGGSS
eukprot:COSAG01_NODE_96_length_26789_cov_36.697089_27_plen_194_part_00